MNFEKELNDYFVRIHNLKSYNEVNDWQHKFHNNGFKIKDLDKAAKLLIEFMHKRICIMGDYDVDGINSVTILKRGFKRAGFTQVAFLIPNRDTEGFGLNKNMIDKAYAAGCELIITCDNGVAQIEAINYAKSIGLTVIITDHHEPSVDGLPDADIIIDPKAIPNSSDYDGYCGAGICYKLIKELFSQLSIDDTNTEKQLLGAAAIATIADVMELHSENYIIVKEGLKALREYETSIPTIYALISCLGFNNRLVAEDIAFKIGPCINAQSRMNGNGAMHCVNMLIDNPDYQKAIQYANYILKVNDERKEIQKEQIKIGEEYIRNHGLYGSVPMILYLPDCPFGIIGIVAGRFTEKYQRPVIVLSDKDNNILRGSGRACGNFDLKKELDQRKDIFTHYGGHKEACGLSFKKENFEKFIMSFINYEGFVPPEPKENHVDFTIDYKDFPAFCKFLDNYIWGNGSPKPIINIENFKVIPKYGKFAQTSPDNNIVKFYGEKDTVAINFDMKLNSSDSDYSSINISGVPGCNNFNGKINYQVEIIRLSINKRDDIKTPFAMLLQNQALKSNS